MLKIDYDKIYKNYNKNLLNKLRGFNSKETYLEEWIPSESLHLSLISLIKILHKNKKNIKIKINFQNEKNFKEILLFEKNIRNYCNSKINKNSNLSLVISNINLELFDKFKIKKFKIKKISKVKHHKAQKKINLIGDTNKKKNDFVFELSKKEYEKIRFKNYFFENKNYYISLIYENNAISKLNYYSKSKNFLERFLLDNICKLSINKNIYFFKNDLLNYLEFNIRNKKINKKIPGIISVVILTKYLSKYNSIISELSKKVIDDNKKNFIQSKEEIDINSELIIKNTQIYNENNNTNIEIVNINNLNNHITIKIENSDNKKFIPEIIFDFDKFLKDSLNQNLDVYYTERKDLNKLRNKNLK